MIRYNSHEYNFRCKFYDSVTHFRLYYNCISDSILSKMPNKRKENSIEYEMGWGSKVSYASDGSGEMIAHNSAWAL